MIHMTSRQINNRMVCGATSNTAPANTTQSVFNKNVQVFYNMVNTLDNFSRGIIEGFFGRSWSWQARQNYASFLKQNNYQYYIYAPKADRYLRRQWAEPWPDADYTHLQQLGQVYRQANIAWGIGITPFEIHHSFDDQTKAQLDCKIRSINNLQPDILAILFDDMRGDDANIAQVQAAVTHRIMEQSTASSFIMCPTYYSTDPVLDKVFGDRPANYLEALGQLLDAAVHVFWTGEKVCSTAYPAAHLQEITVQLGRKPFIWDNYPVNDGAKICKFLHLRPFGESAEHLAKWTAGHAINPMNQAYLSQIPLMTLTGSDQQSPLYSAARSLGGETFATYLVQDISAFQDEGLDLLSAKRKQWLIDRYIAFQTPHSQELVDWLKGEYPFDPACLTD
jgi:hyaluronoglucosaminidase